MNAIAKNISMNNSSKTWGGGPDLAKPQKECPFLVKSVFNIFISHSDHINHVHSSNLLVTLMLCHITYKLILYTILYTLMCESSPVDLH